MIEQLGFLTESLKPLAVLVIDHDPAFAGVLSQILELDFGADPVAVAPDCEKARTALATERFDLVIIDYQVPGGNGLELLEEIQAADNPPPVIMVTGNGDERIASEAFMLGAAGYVVKDGRARAILPETVRGILEREKYRKALERSERLFRMLAENMSDNVWVMDLKLNRLYTSPSVERILGRTPAEALALSLSETMTADSYEAVVDQFLSELKKEDSGGEDPDRIITVEIEVVLPDSGTGWTETHARFLRDERGKAVGILGVTRDVTEKRRVLEELKASEERFRIITANIPDYIWTTDLELTLTYVSPAVERLGYNVDELMGKSLMEFITPESFKKAIELLTTELAIADGTADVMATVFEIDLVRKDGSTVRAQVSAGFLRDTRNKPYGLLGSAREIA